MELNLEVPRPNGAGIPEANMTQGRVGGNTDFEETNATRIFREALTYMCNEKPLN
jgi:hypothetical protein